MRRRKPKSRGCWPCWLRGTGAGVGRPVGTVVQPHPVVPGQRPAPDAAQQLGRPGRRALLGRGSFAELETLYAADRRGPSAMAHGLEGAGRRPVDQNLHEQALQAKTRATALAPGDTRPRQPGQHPAQGLGTVTQAIASHERAAAADPDNPQRHAVLGGLLRGQQRMHAAAAAYRRALQLPGRFGRTLERPGQHTARPGPPGGRRRGLPPGRRTLAAARRSTATTATCCATWGGWTRPLPATNVRCSWTRPTWARTTTCCWR